MMVAVIGAGAAGFFSAIAVAENYPQAKVILYEKSKKLLAKVQISGGGRCNVTNGCEAISELARAYPRGEKFLKKAFREFSTADTMRWFESRGVRLYTQADGRVFPTSDRSESVIDCLTGEARRLKVTICSGVGVNRILPEGDRFKLFFGDPSQPAVFDKVIIATGGSPKRSGLEWLENLGHRIESPVPSLFTFNLRGNPVTSLMGLSVENARVHIGGTRLNAVGPVLITHWGLSGPAILKLSAFAARLLNTLSYDFQVHINWVGEMDQAAVADGLRSYRIEHPNKHLVNLQPYAIPERLWRHLLGIAGIETEITWGQVNKKALNKLTELLTNSVYHVQGKTTFKEEFVTCGGVSLSDVDVATMQSKVCKNLYFAGEVLDIDGITGGYNFQAAWTTGFIAGRLG